MKVTALIPIKYNSERVKGKNFKDFCGKPLLRWVIDTLISSEKINKIVINTDARDVLEKEGLNDESKIILRDRKQELCGDFVSTNLIAEDDIKYISSDIYLMTHTTNPLLSLKSIEQSIETFSDALKTNKYDSLFTVNKIQTRFYDKNVKPLNHDPDNLIRTQDLEPWYEENSNLYLFTKEGFHKTSSRIGSNPMMFETPLFESIDIDTPDDWEIAEVLVNKYKSKGIL